MPQFDLDWLLQFEPPTHLCEKCFAINQPAFPDDETLPPRCSICGVIYRATRDYAAYDFERYLSSEARTGIQFADPISHGIKLAEIARDLRSHRPRRSHIWNLNELLLAADQFVHFMSWGINHTFIGALKLVSNRVPVRGIVSNISADFTEQELQDAAQDNPNFLCQIFDRAHAPHTKMIVIDGLIMLSGSPNLTTGSWRKIGANLEKLTVETHLDKVSYEHNRYFSSIWGRGSRIGDQIRMSFRIQPPP
jgi:hypothetical protein